MKLRTLLTATAACTAFMLPAANAYTILGTGNAALVGNDLTDLGNDGVPGSYAPPALGGFDAEFFSSNEPGFGGGEFAFNVFSNTTGGGSNKWCCGVGAGNPITPQIVGAMNFASLGVGEYIRLERFTLTSSNDSPQRDPQGWSIEGSNDTTTGLDGTWTTVFDHDVSLGNDWTARNQVIAYGDVDGDTFLTTSGFTAFRLNTTATGATSGAFHALAEIEFFGTAVPEPSSTFALAGLAGLGLVLRRRR